MSDVRVREQDSVDRPARPTGGARDAMEQSDLMLDARRRFEGQQPIGLEISNTETCGRLESPGLSRIDAAGSFASEMGQAAVLSPPQHDDLEPRSRR